MNLRHSTASFAVLFIASLFVATPDAHAQKAALVQNVDDAARAPYQEGLTTSCTFPGNCALSFPAVPAGRRRVVEQVSCFIFLDGGTMQSLSLNSTSFRLPRAFLPLVPAPGSATIFTTNAPTLLFFNAGEAPRIDTFSSGGVVSTLFCTLSGRDVAAP